MVVLARLRRLILRLLLTQSSLLVLAGSLFAVQSLVDLQPWVSFQSGH